MWEETERSPALAAPGSNDYVGLCANSTAEIVGSKTSKVQALSDEDANNLALRFKPLAFSIAGRYRNKGVALDELRSVALLGLVKATKKFDSGRGIPFGSFAQHWVKGEILTLFKPTRDALSRGRALSLNAPVPSKNKEEDAPSEFMDLVADESTPAISPDLTSLSGRERLVIEARLRGETLAEIGKDLGVSAERVRQLETRARPKIKGMVASEAISELTKRGDSNVIIRFPVERTRRSDAEFRDREPPKHIYREPKPSRQLTRHRVLAAPLATMRGGEPLRNPNGPYGGPVIHTWGRP
jgi:RNA polymerase sigma factor (sigma-70 family)